MKKTIAILFSLIFLNAQAQQQPLLKNKRAILILPQKGDYCIGFSANPFLSYFGNMFNNSNSNNSPFAEFAATNYMLFGKYMKANDLAYRASFRVGFHDSSQTFNVMDMSPGAPINGVLNDVHKQRSSVIGLGLGFEKRKGSTRIQGFYGAEAYINYATGNTLTYKYGNQLENLDTNTMRVKKKTSSSSFSIGFRGFAGVEYFIAPRFSIGAELGYGPSVSFNSASKQIVEQYDFTAGSTVEYTTTLSPKSRSFSLDTDNANGILKLLFYF